MKKGCIISLIVIAGLIIGVILLSRNAFESKHFIEKIPQTIGGELICNAEYNVDLHTGHYFIDYKYFNGNDTIPIGYANFSSRKWEKNEQLIKYGDWYILKTGCFHGGDKLLIGDKDLKNWREFVILPKKIEEDSLWIKSKILSLENYSPSSSLITKIDSGLIFVDYKYRVDEKITRLIETSQIIYKISKPTGNIKMIDIKVLKREREQ